METMEQHVQKLMKRCQVGVGGKNALDDAHDIMAECYGTLGVLLADKLRIDWLADVNNRIGTVQLPREIVEANVHSLRAAIDAAMKLHAPSNV